MKHFGYTNKETWHKNGYESVKARQIEMIKRHYPDYTESDWVLWIVPELFRHYYAYEIVGTIQVMKEVPGETGTVLETLDIPYSLRTPYPNKNIRQLSFVSGRKRLYGIPLVFKSFEELSLIKEIRITWEIYYPTYQTEDEKNVQHPEYRFFTVFSKDKTTFSSYERDDDSAAIFQRCASYYGEFDTALQTEGSIVFYDLEECGDDSPEFEVAQYYDNNYIKKEEEHSYFNEEELALLSYMETLHPKADIMEKYRQETIAPSEVSWRVYEQLRTETLHAEYMADFLAEQCFGFKSLEK